MYDIRQVSRKVQNFVSSYSELENLIREATNTDGWGPTSSQEMKICSSILASVGQNTSSDEYNYNDIDLSHTYDETESYYNTFDYGNNTGNVPGKAILFFFKRIVEYSGSKNMNIIGLVGLNGKTTASEAVYNNFKKRYLNSGQEYRIILKSLQLLEYLLLHCFTPNNSFDIKHEIKHYESVLKYLKNSYQCTNSADHKNTLHTKLIKEKSEAVLSLIDDSNSELLAEKRIKLSSVANKIALESNTSLALEVGNRNRNNRSSSTSIGVSTRPRRESSFSSYITPAVDTVKGYITPKYKESSDGNGAIHIEGDEGELNYTNGDYNDFDVNNIQYESVGNKNYDANIYHKYRENNDFMDSNDGNDEEQDDDDDDDDFGELVGAGVAGEIPSSASSFRNKNSTNSNSNGNALDLLLMDSAIPTPRSISSGNGNGNVNGNGNLKVDSFTPHMNTPLKAYNNNVLSPLTPRSPNAMGVGQFPVSSGSIDYKLHSTPDNKILADFSAPKTTPVNYSNIGVTSISVSSSNQQQQQQQAQEKQAQTATKKSSFSFSDLLDEGKKMAGN
ncbi:hypothetical protein PACTADRAFT_47839 [Pachysolen tannophilus NRRL Y-2460]|uniref:ENTH domain-containing protein n=1 Tax=Pachysolen tannophilus NRRL Y-2460 TaxID=669874 RepID=A0A1E4U202_PACTA|nr:hypothetical protein PACTADRAFT_47839 [Pachysolen tannophilus NRRL Y-2460]